MSQKIFVNHWILLSIGLAQFSYKPPRFLQFLHLVKDFTAFFGLATKTPNAVKVCQQEQYAIIVITLTWILAVLVSLNFISAKTSASTFET